MEAARHFELTQDPFTALIDPADAFDSAPFRAAREQLLGELLQSARLIMLIGAAGTGKTLLLRSVERALLAAGRRVMRIDRGDLVPEAVTGVDVLLVDEAARMDRMTLAELVHNAGDPNHPAVVVSCIDRCLDGFVGPVLPRVVTLAALGPADARDMALDRVARAGGKPSLFAPGALSAITYAAAGSPRRLRLLSSGALFHAAQDGAQRVEMGHARRAIAMQNGKLDEASLPPDPEAVPLDLSPCAERMEAVPLPVRAPEPAAPSKDIPRAPIVAAAPAALAEPAREPYSTVPPPAVADRPQAMPPERKAVEPELTADRHWIRPAASAAAAIALIGGGFLLWPRSAAYDTQDVAAPAPAVMREAVVEPEQPLPLPDAAPVAPPVLQSAQVPPAATAPPAVAEPTPAAEPAATANAAPPAVVPPTVTVRYPSNEPGAADAARRVADLLRARGYEVAGITPAPSPVVQASIRYPSGASTEAGALNDVFEQALQAYQPGAISRTAQSSEADPGVMEVWVPNSAARASRPLRLDIPPS